MIDIAKQYFARMAPVAMGLALAGCAYADWGGDVAGVSLAELDTSGDAPSSIELAGPDTVIITEGTTFTVALEGDTSAGDAMRFDRDDDRLVIARDSDIYDGSRKAIVRVTAPAVSALAIAGSGELRAATLTGDSSIEVAGSGTIDVQSITAERLVIEIAGSGEVTGAGTARALEVEIAGSGDVQLASLSADDVSVEIAGSGDVEVSSDGRASAEIAGSGDVTVFGSASCTVESAGSGSLTCQPRSEAGAAE